LESNSQTAGASGVYRRVTADARPQWADIGSTGAFAIEPDTDWKGRDDEHGRYTMGRFDPHFHSDADEYWLISSGSGVIRIGEDEHRFGPADIICIERGLVHDVVGVHGRVEGFWFQPSGEARGHEHRSPEDAEGHVVPLLSEDASS
jgi:mannose-6-phosphate isomerase-like protein (cupin superfamily)